MDRIARAHRQPVLNVEGLSVDLDVPMGTLHALSDVSISVGRGETLALVGESGCGKTMTSLAVMGLLPDGAHRKARRIALEGQDLLGKTEAELAALRGVKLAMMFQDPLTALNPVYRVGDQLEEMYRYHGRGNRHEARERAEYMLGRVGIAAPRTRMAQYPHQLSGGLRQRVIIAMALMCQPALIIADEPTTALDVTIQAQILTLLDDLRREFDTALLLITHDMGVVARIADRVAVMYGGKVVEQGDVADVFGAPRHPYTEALLGCVPDPHRGGRLGAIPGMVPALVGENAGCLFRGRCGFATADCARGEIPFRTAAAGQAYRCIRPVGAQASRPEAAKAWPNPHVLPPAPAQHDIVLQVRDLACSFSVRHGLFGHARKLQAVEQVNLDLQRGEALAVVGESGSGKTTLARMMLGLLAPTAGSVTLGGRPLAASSPRVRGRCIQAIFQDPYSSLNPRRTVGQIIGAPLKVLGHAGAAERRRAIAAMMEMVSLPSYLLHSYAGQLSGGQRQRVAIARALVMRPDIVVCDEPTSALDVSVQAQILNLLADLRRELGLTYVFISHDLAVVRHIADRAAVMYLGRIVETGLIGDIFARPRHPYTQALLAAALTPDPRLGLPEVRLGRGAADPMNRPAGCHFHTRCPIAVDTCRRDAPPVRAVDDRLVECHLAEGVALDAALA